MSDSTCFTTTHDNQGGICERNETDTQEMFSLDPEITPERDCVIRDEAENEDSAISRMRLRFGYACGHAQNDFCATLYFSYLLVYLDGLGLSPVAAGVVLIVGQVVDGITTPIVGYLSDRVNCMLVGRHCCSCFAGRRKSWYISGLLLVSATFWVLFTPYPQNLFLPLQPLGYYTLANCLFQIGWATVQVSHMAMVPELTPVVSERFALNSAKFVVTVGTSITVYALLWALTANDAFYGSIATAARPEQMQEEEKRELLRNLQVIAYTVLLSGGALALVFILLVHEDDGPSTEISASTTHEGKNLAMPQREQEVYESENTLPEGRTIFSWMFRTKGFMGVTTNYTLTRLCFNSIQIYLPFFVIHCTSLSDTAVATVPMTAYVAMSASSTLAPRVSCIVSDSACLYFSGAAYLFVGTALLFYSPPSDSSTPGWVFSASFLLGAGCAQLMVTSQTQLCELVGSDRNGGVVFGINSLYDKVCTGLVILGIQKIVEGADESFLSTLYRVVAAVVPLSTALVGGLSLLTVPKRIRQMHGTTNGTSFAETEFGLQENLNR